MEYWHTPGCIEQEPFDRLLNLYVTQSVCYITHILHLVQLVVATYLKLFRENWTARFENILATDFSTWLSKAWSLGCGFCSGGEAVINFCIHQYAKMSCSSRWSMHRCSLWDKDYGRRRATMDTIRMPGSQSVHCVPYPCMCLLMLIVLTYTCILNNTLIFAGFGHGRQNKTLDRIPLALASSLTYTTWSDGQRAYSHIHVIVSQMRPAKMRTSMHMLLHCSVVRLAKEDSMNMVEITAIMVRSNYLDWWIGSKGKLSVAILSGWLASHPSKRSTSVNTIQPPCVVFGVVHWITIPKLSQCDWNALSSSIFRFSWLLNQSMDTQLSLLHPSVNCPEDDIC